MYLEAPADAWYVWIAVSLASLAIAGVVLGLPTGPPPDANGVTNAIERTNGDPDETAVSVGHEADEIRIDEQTVSLRNEHGISHSSVSYGSIVHVTGSPKLENLTAGVPFETEYADEIADPDTDAVETFEADLDSAAEKRSGVWTATKGSVRATSLESVARGMPTQLEVRFWGPETREIVLVAT